MPVTIQIPSALRRFVGGQPVVVVAGATVPGATVRAAIDQLACRFNRLSSHLFDSSGVLRSTVQIFAGGRRVLDLDQRLAEDHVELAIVPAIVGGAGEPRAHRDVLAGSDLPELTSDEILRYSRHLILPEIGTGGQQRLKAARVLMVGTGGLGSPIGMYLAAAGVGTLGMVDFDVVDASNLHRQLLYGQGDIGRPKLEAAAERLAEVNPHVDLVCHDARLDSTNALEIADGYDLIVDGTDNFPTRYLVNDLCVLTGRPNVYGSIFRFEGQVSVFWGAEGPCYRCLFPEPPPPGLVPSCAEGGVLGVLPGIVGCLQANEVIKLLVGEGEPMIGRLLLVDALRLRFRELALRKNPDCPICSPEPTIKELIDYHEFCGVPRPGATEETEPDLNVTVAELERWLGDHEVDLTLVDVRTAEERQICRIEGAVSIPIAELEERLDELDASVRIVVHCHKGPRSTRAVHLLREAGFARTYNLEGGIDAWSVQVDPSVPRY